MKVDDLPTKAYGHQRYIWNILKGCMLPAPWPLYKQCRENCWQSLKTLAVVFPWMVLMFDVNTTQSIYSLWLCSQVVSRLAYDGIYHGNLYKAICTWYFSGIYFPIGGLYAGDHLWLETDTLIEPVPSEKNIGIQAPQKATSFRKRLTRPYQGQLCLIRRMQWLQQRGAKLVQKEAQRATSDSRF